MAAPAFVKNPKFIGATIIVLWVAYVVYWNYRLEPINIQLLPGHQTGATQRFFGDHRRRPLRMPCHPCDSVLLAQGRLEERLPLVHRLRRQHQNRRLSAGLEHGRVGRTDKQRVGARE